MHPNRLIPAVLLVAIAGCDFPFELRQPGDVADPFAEMTASGPVTFALARAGDRKAEPLEMLDLQCTDYRWIKRQLTDSVTIWPDGSARRIQVMAETGADNMWDILRHVSIGTWQRFTVPNVRYFSDGPSVRLELWLEGDTVRPRRFGYPFEPVFRLTHPDSIAFPGHIGGGGCAGAVGVPVEALWVYGRR